jgi:Carboxypeptidase regulatory-like domain
MTGVLAMPMSTTQIRCGWLITLTLILTGCDGHTSISGTVSDSNGSPIEGADVILVAPHYDGYKSESITDTDGKFSLGVTHAPGRFSLSLRVSKANYKDYESAVSSNVMSEKYSIVLEPEK